MKAFVQWSGALCLVALTGCAEPPAEPPESTTAATAQHAPANPAAGEGPPPGAPPGGMPPGAMPPSGMPPGGPPPMPSVFETDYTAAVLIRDGVMSVDRGLVGEQTITDSAITALTLSTSQAKTNGVLLLGEASQSAIENADLNFTGVGENDFLGIGAGAMVAGGRLTIRDSKIVTAGATASATVATDRGYLEVRDSVLIARGGPLPDDYTPRIGPGMMEPPPPLLISGTARTHITMKDAKSYFYDTRIEADGWGALSTDAAGTEAYLEANNCTIIVRNSGYGAYADFGAKVVLNGGTMDVATYGVVIAGPAEAAFNDLAGSSDGNMAMIHSVMGRPTEIGLLSVTGGDFVSEAESILVKSANARISVDGARLESKSGVLMRVRKNEDPNATVVGDAVPPGVTLTLANGRYVGDVIDDDPERDVVLVLKNATLVGNVQNVTVQKDAQSEVLSP